MTLTRRLCNTTKKTNNSAQAIIILKQRRINMKNEIANSTYSIIRVKLERKRASFFCVCYWISSVKDASLIGGIRQRDNDNNLLLWQLEKTIENIAELLSQRRHVEADKHDNRQLANNRAGLSIANWFKPVRLR